MLSGNRTVGTLRDAEELAKAEPNSAVTIQDPDAEEPPPRYEPSPPPYSIPKRANEVYRTANPKGHYHLRVYDTRWTVEYDRFHPAHHPLQHAIRDATVYTALVAAAVGAVVTKTRHRLPR